MPKLLNNHRGRFQAQGLGLEESENWSQLVPLPIRQGNTLLTALGEKLSRSDFELRKEGFYECSIHINRVHRDGGYHVTNEPISKHFPKIVRPGGARVDLEVNKGSAFI